MDTAYDEIFLHMRNKICKANGQGLQITCNMDVKAFQRCKAPKLLSIEPVHSSYIGKTDASYMLLTPTIAKTIGLMKSIFRIMIIIYTGLPH